jgi:hypothetical protein
MPRKSRAKSGALDSLSLPVKLQSALDALHGHYERTFALWQQEKIAVPPVVLPFGFGGQSAGVPFLAGEPATEGRRLCPLTLSTNGDALAGPTSRPSSAEVGNRT